MPMSKHSIPFSAVVLFAALAIPSKALAISQESHFPSGQLSHLKTSSPLSETASNVRTLEIQRSTLQSEATFEVVGSTVSQQSMSLMLAQAPDEALMLMAKAAQSSDSEETSKVEGTGAYSSEEKSGYLETETTLAQSSYQKSASSDSSKYLPWWRWVTLMPFAFIFIGSFFENKEITQYDSDEHR